MAPRAGQPAHRGPLLPGLLLLAAALSRPAAPCPFQCYCFGGPKLMLRCASGAELRQPPRDVPPDARNLTIVGANLTVLRAAAFAGGDADGEEAEAEAAGGVRLPLLTALRLTHNNIEMVEDGAFDGLPSLAALDLSHNPLRALGGDAFRGLPALRSLQLNHALARGGPALLAALDAACGCAARPLLAWMRNATERVPDARRLRCASPRALYDRPFLDLDEAGLRCAEGDADGRGEEVELDGPELEASYVFFGLVLALIGLIFLMVLYLNRRGIQRWMRNLREACRDQMEGYHYRYEQDADPRRAPASAAPAGSGATSPGSGL
ncbi:LOW QUALITY PROTEIN: trophoblast glycoprotein-like [Neophocaena asiaeorientalis asiaeorientalis]|uniref:LOW QUALITY PROTEIN: trophoblast glycoprotein-like n=1 Tax=Neophocaena asiaeorientalis asiaeorientalis TaxID=1706337 RepID=A0A341CSE4_NEOAA|nr:LOW QUALITY PROTEIN: trophoblast glycoprotein-like [Neophocaena asiaeorientalis asiaeorientalis]